MCRAQKVCCSRDQRGRRRRSTPPVALIDQRGDPHDLLAVDDALSALSIAAGTTRGCAGIAAGAGTGTAKASASSPTGENREHQHRDRDTRELHRTLLISGRRARRATSARHIVDSPFHSMLLAYAIRRRSNEELRGLALRPWGQSPFSEDRKWGLSPSRVGHRDDPVTHVERRHGHASSRPSERIAQRFLVLEPAAAQHILLRRHAVFGRRSRGISGRCCG